MDDYRGPKFIGIIGHESVSHNGSKTTVYFLQVQVDGAMYVVKHRYHDFKDFYDKVRLPARAHARVRLYTNGPPLIH